MLFVHGAGGGGWEWNVWARMFAAEGFLVRAPDLQPADAGLAQTQLAHYSDQVRTHIETLRRELSVRGVLDLAENDADEPKIVLVGASLGGLLALMNADGVDALILVNPIPPMPVSLQLPGMDDYPPIISWSATATLAGTRRAIPDADELACLYAFRRWRDEAGAVLNAARSGVAVPKTDCPILVIASGLDEDIPPSLSETLAAGLAAEFVRLPGASHVGPLLGRKASDMAAAAIAWLNGFGPNEQVQRDLTR